MLEKSKAVEMLRNQSVIKDFCVLIANSLALSDGWVPVDRGLPQGSGHLVEVL